MEQSDFFETPRFNPLASLLSVAGEPATIVIGCGRRKRRSKAPARQLYTSERFQMACASAEALGAPYFIMSGLHGLVRPDDVIEPYDVDLGECAPEERLKWGDKVVTTLRAQARTERVCILSSATYSDPIMASSETVRGRLAIVSPLASVEARLHDAWHAQALSESRRYADLKRFYSLIAAQRRDGETFLLSELSKRKLPTRGVYIFMDPAEPNFADGAARIVRVGTHAVSRGSKSTLKGRLRQHLGVSDGTGNHRGSIFRLHVGRALLERERAFETLSTWGSGQNAPLEVRQSERDHEKRVTDYLKALEVFVLSVDDEASKDSMRASVEQQLIGLCSHELRLIDRIGAEWLGRHSPMALIANSGLWNLRAVGSAYQTDGRGSVTDIESQGLAHGRS